MNGDNLERIIYHIINSDEIKEVKVLLIKQLFDQYLFVEKYQHDFRKVGVNNEY